MKTVREHFITKFTSLVLTFSILLMSCSNNNEDIINNDNINQLSGKDYFNAIYFKKGDLANEIYKNDLDGLKKNNTQFDKDAVQIQEVILSTLIEQNPNFMVEFERGIKSKNLKTTEAIVNKGGELIFETVKTMIDDETLKNNLTFQKFAKSIDGSESYAKEVACLLYLVAVFAIAVYAAVYFWKIGPRGVALTDADSSSQLYKEQFIYSIYELQQ